MIIVIDGLSGSGKSSTAKAVAREMGIQYLDSGALYRAVTYIWMEYPSIATESFIEILLSKEIRFLYEDQLFRVFIDDREVTGQIRSKSVSDSVSMVASMPEVRRYVNRLMHRAVKEADYIADGRDLGSAVFPDAEFKFYMTAPLEIRAERRHAELTENGISISLDEVRQNLSERDHLDMTRVADPLRKPEGAIEIDTSGKTFDQQVDEICSIIRDRRYHKQKH